MRAFAEEVQRDHTAVDDQALALVKKLGVTPQDNPTSQSLSKNAADELKKLAALKGSAFDKAYADNEVAYHQGRQRRVERHADPVGTERGAEVAAGNRSPVVLVAPGNNAEHLAQSLK